MKYTLTIDSRYIVADGKKYDRSAAHRFSDKKISQSQGKILFFYGAREVELPGVFSADDTFEIVLLLNRRLASISNQDIVAPEILRTAARPSEF